MTDPAATADAKAGPGKAPSKPDHKAVLARARKRFALCAEAHRDNHASYVADTAFSSAADQWDPAARKARGDRPALTFNRLDALVEGIVGSYRQNKLSCKVLPASGDASADMAEVFAGLLRNVEAVSNADMAYVNALHCAARGGFGYFRILTDYAGDDTFDQELRVEPVFNPLTVQFDPHAKRSNRSDARYCFVTETVPRDDFRQAHPDAKGTGFDLLDSGDKQHWLDGDSVRVAEYFEKVDRPVRLVRFESGLTAAVESDEQLDGLLAVGEVVQAERQATRTSVDWYKLTGTEVVDHKRLPIPHIPVVPVLGKEVNLEGKTLLRGAGHYAQDAQRMLNYWLTAATETVALAPKGGVMMTPEQYEGNEDSWDPSNPTNVRLYNAAGDALGQPLPQPLSPPAQPVGEMAMAQGAEAQIKATTGLYDPSLGNRSAASSGIAINSLQRAGDNVTALYTDNLREAIEWGGRVMIAWVPAVYDAERVVRILDLEGNPKTEVLNKREHDPLTGVTRVLNAVGAGKYDVVVTTAPDVATQRQEMLAAMQQVLPALPIAGQVAADLIIKNMPFHGAEEIAARVKRALPPQITEDRPDGDPQAQQQQAQAQQQAQQQALRQQQAEQQGQAQLAAAKLELERAKIAGERETQQGDLALKREQQRLERLRLAVAEAHLLAPPHSPSDGASAPRGPAAVPPTESTP